MLYTQHEFLALDTYLQSFSKKSDAQIYITFKDSSMFLLPVLKALHNQKHPCGESNKHQWQLSSPFHQFELCLSYSVVSYLSFRIGIDLKLYLIYGQSQQNGGFIAFFGGRYRYGALKRFCKLISTNKKTHLEEELELQLTYSQSQRLDINKAFESI